VIITGTARDKISRISSLYFMDQEGLWEILKPEDGICDQPEETFRIVNSKRSSGYIIIKAIDNFGNVGYTKVKY